MKLNVLVFFLEVLLLVVPVQAVDHIMIQSDKVFLGDIPAEKIKELWDNPLIEREYKVKKMKAKVGDTIIFKNRDEVSHNVSGKIEKKTIFDVTLQAPGKENDKKISLKKPGTYTVQCAIHPKMKLEVVVEK